MNTTNNFKQDSSKSDNSIGIRGRLVIGFSAIALIFVTLIIADFVRITEAKEDAAKVIIVDLRTYDNLVDLNNKLYLTQISLQGMLLGNPSRTKSELVDLWDKLDKSILLIDDISRSWTNREIIAVWPKIKTMITQLKILQLKVVDELQGPNKSQALQLFQSEVNPLTNEIYNLINPIIILTDKPAAMLDVQLDQLEKGTKGIIENLTSIQITALIFSVLGVIFSILIGVFTARSIIKHINIFRDFSKRIASGDLTQFVKVSSSDEMGQLGNDLNIMTDSLATITKEITESCHNMVSTLEEVRHSVDKQAAGASEQAASINEITSSLSEIEKSSAQTMAKAKSLGESAEQTRIKGQLGLDAVDQSISGMNEVREKVQLIAQTILDLSNQTQQVGEITAVVNNLAQQSKMLALNASIEAAKAGEAGKGFAVVAVEVKNLAEQSELATTQVQKILEDIRHAAEKAVMVTEEGTKGVDRGTVLVEQTGDTIRNLNDVIHETTIATQQIESAVRQEGAGIEQITTGMNEINQVTATFVESVKQTTEAISNLAVIAQNLKKYVDSYKF